ncbi:GNAT family N-acetyltransferase [Pseudomonas sp. X10]
MDVQIMPASPEDLPDIATVTVRAWQATFSGLLPDAFLADLNVEEQLQRHQKLYSSPSVIYYVAKAAGEVVGFASGGPNRSTAFDAANELYALYLLPHWQQRGVGWQLFRAVAMQLQAPGRQGLLALVLSNNPHRYFYSRCGGLKQLAEPIELGGLSWPLEGYRWSQAPAVDTRVFNPDHYLETVGGRVFTQQRNGDAWRLAMQALQHALSRSGPDRRLMLVIGVQGSGKSTWIDQHRASADATYLYFDAALPRREHRAPILQLAARYGVSVTSVWVRVSVEEALARNALRREDHRVPQASIEAVNAAFEPPTVAEGFDEVLEA